MSHNYKPRPKLHVLLKKLYIKLSEVWVFAAKQYFRNHYHLVYQDEKYNGSVELGPLRHVKQKNEM